jgi:hypothetical protein
MSAVFTDDFNRANNTALGANWNEARNDSSINTNRMRLGVYTTLGASLVLTTTTAHAAIADCKVQVTQVSGSGDGGPVARVTNSGATPTYYAVDVYTGACETYRHDAAAAGTLLRTAAITQVANGVIALQVSGTGATVTLKQFYQGTQRGADVSDTSANRITSATQTGIYNWATSAANCDYDDFSVDDLVVAGGVTGDANITEAGDTVSGAGSVLVTGSSAITEAGDTLAAAGTNLLTGAAAITEAGDSVSATATNLVTGNAAITEASDSVSSTGTHPVTGSAAINEGGDSISSAGSVLVTANAAITEAADTLSATGGSGTFASADITEANDGVNSAGVVTVTGSGAITEAGDGVSGAASVSITGNANIAENGDANVSSGTVLVTGNSILTEGNDTLSADGSNGAAQVPSVPSWLELPLTNIYRANRIASAYRKNAMDSEYRSNAITTKGAA